MNKGLIAFGVLSRPHRCFTLLGVRIRGERRDISVWMEDREESITGYIVDIGSVHT